MKKSTNLIETFDIDSKRYVLSNGINVVVVDRPHSSTLNYSIQVRFGSNNELPGEEGLAHFIEHMCLKDSVYHTDKQLIKMLDKYGIERNAYTYIDETFYYGSSLFMYGDKLISILNETVFRPVFNDKTFKNERNAVIQEIKRRNDDNRTLTLDSVDCAMFAGRRGIKSIGLESVIAEATVEKLESVYNRNYLASRMTIFIVGRLPYGTQELLDTLERDTAMVRRGILKDDLPAKVSVKPKSARRTPLTFARDTEQNLICKKFYGLNITATSPAGVAMTILGKIYGDGENSHLFKEIRTKRGLAYEVWGRAFFTRKYSYLCAYAGVNVDGLKEASDIIDRELKRIATSVTESEVKTAVRSSIADIIKNCDGNYGIADIISSNELCGNRSESVHSLIQRINNVTVEDVRSVAMQLYSNKMNSTVYTVPKEK